MISTALQWERHLQEIAAQEQALAQQKFKLGSLMLNKKLISQQDLNRALTEQAKIGKKLGEILIEKEIISPSTLEFLRKEQTWRKQGLWLKIPTAA